MTTESADPDRPVGIGLVVAQPGDSVDVDQHLGRGEAQLHHRDQALTPGQHLGVAAAFGEKGTGFLDRSGGLVAKSRGIDVSLLARSGLAARVEAGSALAWERLRIGYRHGKRLGLGIGSPLLVWGPRSLNRLAGHLEVLDYLRPGPDGGALAGLGGLFDQLVEAGIATAVTRRLE
jgi:hypothetical protein